jgi:hypothetical protein
MKFRTVLFWCCVVLVLVTIYHLLGLEKVIDMIMDPSVPDVQINR